MTDLRKFEVTNRDKNKNGALLSEFRAEKRTTWQRVHKATDAMTADNVTNLNSFILGVLVCYTPPAVMEHAVKMAVEYMHEQEAHVMNQEVKNYG